MINNLYDFEVGRDSKDYDVCKFIQSFVEGFGGVWDDDEDNGYTYLDVKYGGLDEVKEAIIYDMVRIRRLENVNEEFKKYSIEAIDYLRQ